MFRLADIRIPAESGDKYAQFLMGFLLDNGSPAERDLDKVQQWYEKSARQGFVLAQYGLYKLLWEKKEAEAAIDWLEKAADAGYAPAQAAMGLYLWEDSKTAEERRLAAKRMLAAAEDGYYLAIQNLALMYEEGIDGDPSMEMALVQLRKGAELGSSTCAQMLTDRLLNEGAEAPEIEEGLEWLWFAAKKGEPFAYGRLAELYRFGLYGAPVDEKIAGLFDKLAGDALVKQLR